MIFKLTRRQNMQRLIKLTFLLILTVQSLAFCHEEEIIVKLDTDVSLLPLYLGTFINENSGFDQAYINKLEKVLQFDLNNNGMTFLVKHSSPRDALAKKEAFDAPTPGVQWKALNVHYVVMIKLKEKKLSARLLATIPNTLNAVDNLPLTGHLELDRQTIHQLADQIHQALFGTEGIATTHVLFTLKTKNDKGVWVSDVWEADYDGGNPRRVTQEGGYCVTPAYVPPKSGYASGSFFYVSYLNGQPKIYYASLQDGTGQRFSYMRGNQLMPAISRQRDKIAFISDVTGNPDLFIQYFNPDAGALGKPQQIFASRSAAQGSPAFSQDGRQIAFVSNKDGYARIYVMEIPGPGANLVDLAPRLISKQSRESSAPAWSPDGSKLAYCTLTNGTRQIWLYDFSKREERQITQGPGNKENPAWAPNSLHLIFNSTDSRESELYLINLNQPKAVKITSGPGEKHYPDWEPKFMVNR